MKAKQEEKLSKVIVCFLAKKTTHISLRHNLTIKSIDCEKMGYFCCHKAICIQLLLTEGT